ncbi:hypothetical protein CYLTODRAFT_413948 [Cylindrobasidium torrendii FP15055 ss-10]|uniref:Uncharacterized protein n=1 Tax=Cylindrobasidium torrendii FP15055 ss-10 TaxID=1314674 RepID=A0A0D7B1Z9_9AGAR|nr:hypothetical protein CYLTODRAFT_413948 [Cylindrobasidium torrendii FP15055 ss-10]
MQQTKGRMGYSDFFASGLRSVLKRGNKRAHARGLFDSPPSSPLGRSFKSPATHASQDQPSVSRLSFSYKRTSRTAMPDKQRRRESFVDFSSQLLGRLSNAKSSHKRSTSLSSLTRPASPPPQLDVWITEGGPFSLANTEAGEQRVLDPFGSSPDATSIFIDLIPRPTIDISHQGKEGSIRECQDPVYSFLSMSSESLELGPAPSTTFAHSKSKSISYQDMPLSPLEMEEEEMWTFHLDFVDEEEEDLTNRIDWRSFHVDILLDE